MLDRDELALKLHTDTNGEIWYAIGRYPPTCSNQTLIPFMLSSLLQQTEVVRVAGTDENAHLITALYGLVRERKLEAVEVCSPQALPHGTAAATVLALRNYKAPSSIGGWHPIDTGDYFAYALMNQVRKMGHVDPFALRLLEAHPAWQGLSFVPTVDHEAACHLLNQIIDPRWFIDQKYPNRLSKLFSFLGLSPRGMQEANAGKNSVLATRYANVRACWMGKGKPDKEGLRQPGNFAWRIFIMMGNEKAELRASQAFVAFMRHTWLDALYAGKQREHLFEPELFFEHQFEVDGYRKHMQTPIGQSNGGIDSSRTA